MLIFNFNDVGAAYEWCNMQISKDSEIFRSSYSFGIVEPTGLIFNDDGTKHYDVGADNNSTSVL